MQFTYFTERPVRWLAEDEILKILAIPYKSDRLSMVILLPDSAHQIDSLAVSLTQGVWDSWIAGLATNTVRVSIPRFTVEYEIGLRDVLVALGMGIAFSGDADFTRMFPPGGIYIDSVKHKAFVDVNEEGTEAAAATSVSMARGGLPDFVVDRPFIFAIREKYSGAILFMGKVMDPTAG